MRKYMTIPRGALWIQLLSFLVVLPVLWADDQPAEKKNNSDLKTDKEKEAAEPQAREARIKALMQQMEKLQRALAEETAKLGPPGGVANFKEMQERMQAEQQRMQAAAREQREQQERAWKSREEMMRRGVFPPGLGSIDPAVQMLQQIQMMLQQLETAGSGPPGAGGYDQQEMGQKMLLAGLEIQLKGMATRIRATEARDAKQKLTADFREVVEKVVQERKKLRELTIHQLEKRIADLKKQGEDDETADHMAKRLLEGDDGNETPTNGPPGVKRQQPSGQAGNRE